MKKSKNIIVGLGLLCFALGCAAVTLGRVQGTVLIGRPLDLRVQAQLGDGEESASTCLEADVFHADNRQDPRNIRVTLEPGAQSLSGVVHIVSGAAVDEPMVTIYLRVGCTQKISRRYVLLAELAGEVVATATLAPPASNGTAEQNTPSRPSQNNTSTATANATPTKPARMVVPKPIRDPEETPPKFSAPPRTAPVAVSKPTGISGKSRLKLDFLDLTEERSPSLKSSSELATLPAEDLQRRAEAAAWWRALNVTPEEAMQANARLQSVESQIDTLKTITETNARSVSALNARVQQAESERYANGLVYALAALLFTMVVALVLLWRRNASRADTNEWMGSPEPTPTPLDLDLGIDMPADPKPTKRPK